MEISETSTLPSVSGLPGPSATSLLFEQAFYYGIVLMALALALTIGALLGKPQRLRKTFQVSCVLSAFGLAALVSLSVLVNWFFQPGVAIQ